MIIIRYDNPKQYGSTQWFVQKSFKQEAGRRFRFMLDGKFDHDFFNDESMMSGPSHYQLKGYGVVETEVPKNLTWHLFDAIFGVDLDYLQCIKGILG